MPRSCVTLCQDLQEQCDVVLSCRSAMLLCQVLREMRQKCHTLTYSLTKLETDYSKLSQEVRAMKEKEQSLRIDEVSLVNTVSQRERQTDRQRQRERDRQT